LRLIIKVRYFDGFPPIISISHFETYQLFGHDIWKGNQRFKGLKLGEGSTSGHLGPRVASTLDKKPGYKIV